MVDRTVTLAADGARSPKQDRPARAGLLLLCSQAELPTRRVFPLVGEVGIGRQADQRIFLDDPGLSREHAQLRAAGDKLQLRDLGSRNGTFLNGAQVSEPLVVRAGDVVRCGTTVMVVVDDAASYEKWPPRRQGRILCGPQLQEVTRAVEIVAQQNTAVLVWGESGTGKELVAQLLHDRSDRPGPFVAVNCAAIPEALFEAELFGVKKGAFTDASTDRPGLLRQASGGTLFLDEVGEMPATMQPKLLRAIEMQLARPVGGERDLRLDLRVVSATNRDLQQEIAEGRFRRDLYHRLCGLALKLPPLHRRRPDIALLANHFLTQSKTALVPTAAFFEKLLLHRWPGNVRELQRVVDQALLSAQMKGSDQLGVDLLDELESEAPGGDEVSLLRAALDRAGGNVAAAASELDMSRSKLYQLLKQHGLRPADFRRRG